MTRCLLLCVLWCAGTTALQAQATIAPIAINGKAQPGLQLELMNTTNIAEGTLLQKLKETGYTPETTGAMFWKKNTQDGFYVFNGVTLPALNNQKLDLYFKIDRKGRKKDEQSTMSMLVSKGYDNFVSPEGDSATFQAATAFLNSFTAGNISYSLQQDIEAQAKNLLNAEKKMANLDDDQKELQKKIADLQSDLRQKEKDRESQAKEVIRQKAVLDLLNAKLIKG